VIVLDTNVVSALMADQADRKLADWLDHIPRDRVWLTVITLFELQYGIELLAPGRRRSAIESALLRIVNGGFQDRILNFDKMAAVAAGSIAATRRRGGRPIEIRDTMIAGIAIAHRADLATRNVRHFQNLDIHVIDPWAE